MNIKKEKIREEKMLIIGDRWRIKIFSK